MNLPFETGGTERASRDVRPLSTDEASALREYFSPSKLAEWGEAAVACSRSHDSERLLEQVRRITMNESYFELRDYGERRDYLIPDASWMFIGNEDVPRDIAMDAGLHGQIMTFSRCFDSGLSEEQLIYIYQHHCVEPLIRYAAVYKVDQDLALQVLSLFINRVINSVSEA